MICGGHAARAHTKQLQKYAGYKSPHKAIIDVWGKHFPDLTTKCKCSGRTHKNKPPCGCLTEAFIRYARLNFFSAYADAAKDPDVFRKNLLSLSLHHVKDEHVWYGEEDIETCPFHPQELCGCGKCETEEPLHCTQRRRYMSSMVLS